MESTIRNPTSLNYHGHNQPLEMASPHLLQLPHPHPHPCFNFSSSLPTLLLRQSPPHIPLKSSQPTSIPLKPFHFRPTFALTDSDSPKSLSSDSPTLPTVLQELSDSFDLPADYFGQLPRDLRLDLNDAAFDLSNGPVIDECGKELGETLLNLSRAWELADASSSYMLASKLLQLEGSLTNNAKIAFGKRLISAGRRFQSMGQYGQGELQRIAKAMTTTGKLLCGSLVSAESSVQPKEETRMLKFGDLQVALTSDKANIGAAISFVFGILTWQLSQGIQSIPESSLQYANDNALLLAKSLRGALLAICYSSTVLSAFVMVGLVLLARELKSEEK